MLLVAFALLAGLPPLHVVRYDGKDCVDVADAFHDGCDVSVADSGGSVDVVCGDKRDSVFVTADLCAARKSNTEMTQAQFIYVGCLRGVIKDGFHVDATTAPLLTQKLQACACKAEPMAALVRQNAGPDALARVAVDCARDARDDDGGGSVIVFGVAGVIVAVAVAAAAAFFVFGRKKKPPSAA